MGDLAGALGGALGGGLKSMARSMGTQLGRELLRGVFGTSSRRRRYAKMTMPRGLTCRRRARGKQPFHVMRGVADT
jgi:hypothetical protein